MTIYAMIFFFLSYITKLKHQRNLKFLSKPNPSRLRPTQNKATLPKDGFLQEHKNRHNPKDKTSGPTVFQYMLSKVG